MVSTVAIREATYLLAVGVVATVTAPVVAAATRTVSALIGSRRGCSDGGSGSSGVEGRELRVVDVAVDVLGRAVEAALVTLTSHVARVKGAHPLLLKLKRVGALIRRQAVGPSRFQRLKEVALAAGGRGPAASGSRAAGTAGTTYRHVGARQRGDPPIAWARRSRDGGRPCRRWSQNRTGSFRKLRSAEGSASVPSKT